MTGKRIFLFLLGTFAAGGWFFVLFRFPSLFIFTTTVPLVAGIHFSKNKRVRNAFITCFVILWILIFHYESLRYFYLQPLLQRPLPQTKFLFPPAGWIMFYNVGDTSGNVEVYGVKDGQSQLIDPHDIFRTRTFGFDNIHRGILGAAAGSNVGTSISGSSGN